MATAARCNRFEVRVNYCGPSACLVYAFERFERESYEREREKERERGGENDEGGEKRRKKHGGEKHLLRDAFGADSFVGFPHLHAPTR